MIPTLQQLDLKAKRIFLRVDYNVPIHGGKVGEPHRIDSTLPTLNFILPHAKTVLIASHLGRPDGKRDPKHSLAPVREYLLGKLSQPVVLAPDCVGAEVDRLIAQPGTKIILLENLRFHKEEEANDAVFSQALASLADVYINDAFGAAHRAHASVSGMVRFFSSRGVGFLMQKEIEYLGQLLAAPPRPFWALLGGAKVSDKIGVIENLLPKLDGVLIGGGMAYTFLRARNVAVGKSLVEEEHLSVARDIMAQAEKKGVRLFLPSDHIVAKEIKEPDKPATVDEIPADLMGLDIGPKTAAHYARELSQAKSVLWNGPMGVFEDERFFHGTQTLASALAQSGAVTIVAGGDTVAAVRQAGIESKITHLSTGGGATLEFLEGKKLPGIAALESA
ncbi:MAG: phosphoglycerate kinase [Candidatus Binatia bacterium]